MTLIWTREQVSLIWKKIRVLRDLCLLYNDKNVTKMEFFGGLQSSLMGIFTRKWQERRCGSEAYCTCEETYCGLQSVISILEKRCLHLNRDDYAENKLRTYFEVGPSFMSWHFLPTFLALLWNDNWKGNYFIHWTAALQMNCLKCSVKKPCALYFWDCSKKEHLMTNCISVSFRKKTRSNLFS